MNSLSKAVTKTSVVVSTLAGTYYELVADAGQEVAKTTTIYETALFVGSIVLINCLGTTKIGPVANPTTVAHETATIDLTL